MRRPSRAFSGLGVLSMLVVLASCGPPETHPDALRRDDGAPVYRDGTYAVSYSHIGPEGWRPYLQIRVRGGLIDQACFGAVNRSEARLLDDERYLEQYRLDTGVDVVSLHRGLTDQLLARQLPAPTIGYGTVPWATAFEVLTRAALRSAGRGITTDSAGVELVSSVGPHVAADAPDALGWRAELVVAYDRDRVVAGSYREYRIEWDGSVREKRDDVGLQQRYEAASGLTTGDVAATLIAELVATGSARVDGVSGATLSTNRFAALAARIESERRAAALPRRLCR